MSIASPESVTTTKGINHTDTSPNSQGIGLKATASTKKNAAKTAARLLAVADSQGLHIPQSVALNIHDSLCYFSASNRKKDDKCKNHNTRLNKGCRGYTSINKRDRHTRANKKIAGQPASFPHVV